MLTRFAVSFSLVLFLAVTASAVAGEAFRFSVMGDNRPPGDREDVVTQPEEFHQAIREVNFLRPDLTLILGDLIMGYTQDEAEIREQWAAFDEAIAAFEIPVVEVAGNHDVWDRLSEKIFLERVGYLHKSFLHKGCRFIVLNSEDLANREKIAGAQLEWLRAELAKPGASRTMVFLHKPFWRYDDALANWNAEVHPLLAEAGVEAVFAGHWHNYEQSTVRDGVRYYITGGAGAEIGENPDAGDFFHHLIVDVPAEDDEPVAVHVLRTGFLAEESIVTEEFREAAFELQQALVPTGIPAREGEDADAMVRLRVSNPWPEPLMVRHELSAEGAGSWRMEPAVCETLLPANGVREVWLRLRAPADDLLPAPAMRVEAMRGEKIAAKAEQYLPVRFERRIAVGRLASPVALDGRLDEEAWKQCAPAGRFLRIDAQKYSPNDTEFRMVRDDEALYLSFRCAHPGANRLSGKFTERDWMMVQDDSIVFYLDPVRDGKTRFCFGATAMGVRMDYRAPGGAVDIAWNPDWGLAASRDDDGWTLEVRIPFSLLGMDPGEVGTIGVNAIRYCSMDGGEISGWSIPASRLSNPDGFGEAVLE